MLSKVDGIRMVSQYVDSFSYVGLPVSEWFLYQETWLRRNWNRQTTSEEGDNLLVTLEINQEIEFVKPDQIAADSNFDRYLT